MDGVAVDSWGIRDDGLAVEGWAGALDETGKSHWKRAIITPRTVKITIGKIVDKEFWLVTTQIMMPMTINRIMMLAMSQRIQRGCLRLCSCCSLLS
jgi:hypothetical protein